MPKKKISHMTKHNWFIRFLKSLLRTFKKKHEILGPVADLPSPAIYIANHDGAGGPLTLNVYFPKILIPWGAYQMTGGYRDRWNYLYHVFYQKKLGYSKARSFVLSTLFALISKILYNGVRLIPTYPDIRVRHTIAESLENLQKGNSLVIFPEDSSNGYRETIETFHAGFVYLAGEFRKTTGYDVPIIPLSFDRKSRRIIVGKPRFLGEFASLSDRNAIANQFRLIHNDLKNS